MDTKHFIEILLNCDCNFFTGVPDSLLSKFSSCLMEENKIKHMIAANEGNAVGLAIGNYLCTGKAAVVYMQNSGLGNTVNPITSLADPNVYGIPMVLIIGWRGQPGFKDEPQHIKQGEVTIGQLNLLNIPYIILNSNTDVENELPKLIGRMKKRNGPVAVVVEKGALTGNYPVKKHIADSTLSREKTIEILSEILPKDTIYIATTGKSGRELYEIREKRHEPHHDFLTVGGMGHASSIALGVSLSTPDRLVACLDGDGAFLMHMGASAVINSCKPKNYLHVLLNNYAHESVGGQPTVSDKIDFSLLSKSVGYSEYYKVSSEKELQKVALSLSQKDYIGCVLVEILINQNVREDLGRPKITPEDNKKEVMKFISKFHD